MADRLISRRDFLKLAGAGATLIIGESILKSAGVKLEGLDTQITSGETVFSNSDVELKASPINGIIDIYDKKSNKLVNNLVMLVYWTDEQGAIHYNNSEIQGVPILVHQDGGSSLTYSFQRDETKPAQQPVSDLILKVGFSNKQDGVLIHTKVVENPKNIKDIKVGIGCFFGINHETSKAIVLTQSQKLIVQPFTNINTSEGQLGSFARYDGGGFTLVSADLKMPSVSIRSISPRSIVDIESRDEIYKPEQKSLLQKYVADTGEESWIEAAIIYADDNPNFILSLEDKL